MTQPDTTALPQPWWPWLAPWPAPAPGTVLPWLGLAPQQLQQAINPGWSLFNIAVTNVNSSAPDVERAIHARHSYGRQLGRMMEALVALAEATPDARKDKRIEEFLAIADDVQTIKRRAELPQVERLREELLDLRRSDKKAWAELSKLFAR